MNKYTIAYPYAFAFYYVLNFFSVNPVVLNVDTLTRAALCFLGLALIAHIIAWAFYKNVSKASLATFYFLIFFLSYIIIEDTFVCYLSPVLSETLSRAVCVIVITAFLTYVVRWLKFTNSSLNIMGTFFGVFILVLLSMSSYTLLQYTWAVREITSYSSEPVFQDKTIDTEQLPDIYHIVLDGYGRSDVLEKYYGLDNSGFTDYLRQNGFTVRDDCHTNYIWTKHSVASMLTMDYLQASNINENLSEQLLINKLKARGAGKILENYGYQYIEIASPLSTIDESNNLVIIESKLNVVLELIYQTPFRYLYNSGHDVNHDKAYDSWRNFLMGKFKDLESIPGKTGGPSYIYCHILMPHPPFVFNAGGNPVNPNYPFTINDASDFLQVGGTVEGYKYGYSQQLLFTNQKIQHVVNTIIANSERPALIIISSDHGPRILVDRGNKNDKQLNEAVPIFFAYRLPHDDDDIPFDSVHSPVNLYRIILNYYCFTNYSILPDKCYYAPGAEPIAN